jgi:hypothetical protein
MSLKDNFINNFKSEFILSGKKGDIFTCGTDTQIFLLQFLFTFIAIKKITNLFYFVLLIFSLLTFYWIIHEPSHKIFYVYYKRKT